MSRGEIKAGILLSIIWFGVPCLYLYSIKCSDEYHILGDVFCMGALILSLTTACIYYEHWKVDQKQAKEKISSLYKEIDKLKRHNDKMRNFIEWQHGWRPSDYQSEHLSSLVSSKIADLEQFFYEERKKEYQEASERISKNMNHD